MGMETQVEFNSVDKTSDMITYAVEDTSGDDIPRADIVLVADSSATITKNTAVEIYRGTSTPTDTKIFKGFVWGHTINNDGTLTIRCYGELAKLRFKDDLFNKIYLDTDTEAGVISEIVKDILTTYTSLTTTTGIDSTASLETIAKFQCINASASERIGTLRKTLNWIFRYDYVNDYCLFQRRGKTTYGSTLYYGGANTNITSDFKWDYAGDDFYNKITVASVQRSGRVVDTITGVLDQTDYDLTAIPDLGKGDISVTVDGTQKTFGVEDVSASGYHYTVDAQKQKLKFVSAMSGGEAIVADYTGSTEVNLPIHDPVSITNYGVRVLPNAIMLLDAEDFADTYIRGFRLLRTFSDPPQNTKFRVDTDLTDIQPGNIVPIEDTVNKFEGSNITGNFYVWKVWRNWPFTGDWIHIGRGSFGLSDVLSDIRTRIRRLEEQQSADVTRYTSGTSIYLEKTRKISHFLTHSVRRNDGFIVGQSCIDSQKQWTTDAQFDAGTHDGTESSGDTLTMS